MAILYAELFTVYYAVERKGMLILVMYTERRIYIYKHLQLNTCIYVCVYVCVIKYVIVDNMFYVDTG